ncbi:MAG: sugar phosphate nucleotidyltransferase [Actinomycetota bacterium]
MRAVVLVGGEGTRLRPLTETTPKPLLPLVDRAFLHQVLDHLGAHGVHEVVASSPYLEATFGPFLAERRGDPTVTWITEAEPLGTAGAIVNALRHLGDEAFLVLNGDVLTDLDLTALVSFHRERAAVATIALTPVEDARPYGLVETETDGRVLEFREKPSEVVGGNINAGTYVLEPRALDGWEPGRMLSIEREVYPALIERGETVYASPSDAYWMDLGTPERYLQAHFDALEGHVAGLRSDAPYVASSAMVDPDAKLGRLVVIGDGARVAAGADIDRSVLHEGVRVEENAEIARSIIAASAHVGRGSVVLDSVVGAGARIPERARILQEQVAPGHPAPA